MGGLISWPAEAGVQRLVPGGSSSWLLRFVREACTAVQRCWTSPRPMRRCSMCCSAGEPATPGPA
eukprot:178392-Lingulodinium_polyedra.AAC.1